MSNPFNEAYFLRGKETGVSLYENYRWMPELTIPMVHRIIDHLGITHLDTICDFGCARGYTVKAFRQLGYEASGVDISEWAIANADPDVFNYVRCRDTVGEDYDWIIAKDVLEHVRDSVACADDLMHYASKGVFVVVPLGMISEEERYVVPEYEQDVTHIHRFTLPTWVSHFLRPGWAVTAQYRVPGIKDNYAQWERGNGFITARRLP